MSYQILIILLLGLLLSMFIGPSSSHSPNNPGMEFGYASTFSQPQKCNGLIADCINPDEEMMMESDISKRILAQGYRYISYGVLKKNKVPCNERGSSYYDCYAHKKVNPYKRGCTAITRCKRTMSY